MNCEIYLAFVVAAAIILVIPGPTIMLVVSQAIAHGRRSVIPLVAGVIMGDFSAMTLSLCGLGTVLSASAFVFMGFKWIGAIYLFYLGIKLWRADPNITRIVDKGKGFSKGALFRSSYIVTALNPKGYAFFGAFLPQFINPQKPAVEQLFLLGTTFLVLALINAALYAYFAGSLRDVMARGHVRKWFNRCGSGAMISAGIITAGMRRSV